MALEHSKPKKAWIIVAEKLRPPFTTSGLGEHPEGQPLAIFPPTWGIDRLAPVVDGFVQLAMQSPEDSITYAKPKAAPYLAKKVAYGTQLEGGFNPYIHAIYVNDLVLVSDTETGKSWFTYSWPKPPSPPTR